MCHQFKVACSFLLIGCCWNPLAIYGKSPPSPEQLLQRLSAHDDSIKTTSSTSLWTDSISGKVDSWIEVTLHTDDLKRVNMHQTHGKFESGKRIALWSERFIYNGDITVKYDYNYDIHKGPRKGDGTTTQAMIHDGIYPDPHGPMMYRNPVSTKKPSFAGSLQKWITKQYPIKITACNDNTKSYTVDLEAPKDVSILSFSATVDPDMGWAVTSINIINRHGDVARTQLDIFRKDSNGHPYIASGWSKQFAAAKGVIHKIPVRSTEFTCSDYKINDPAFPPDIFKIELQPGTYVYDVRYQIAYRVGEQAAVESELPDLAQEAKLRQKQDPLGQHKSANHPSADESRRVVRDSWKSGRLAWLIGLNVAAALGIGAFLAYRRLR